jgi:hypothetical protein
MRARKLGPGEYREMPWKNGGGSTTELLIEPPGATLAGGFRWRLSMAAVADSGPFSCFPGIDRTLLLLEGNGLELDYGAHGRACLPGPLEPVSFAGEWTTRGRLLDGPCRDFNIMTNRANVRQEVHILRPVAATPLPTAPTLLLYCACGAATVNGGQDWLGERLEAGELLRVDDPGTASLWVAAAAEGTALVLAALHPREI